ncbi:cysteine rich repeat-containing protein [Acuticoccus sp. M5D2P5]|uniref:cysteine rich repeat-containing protein n=1 Tax=Acuticoccus kalidii TaxID=2910977 RepID=UPI001F1A84CF|nr:cysteine rich repeat-containing protein [Acuticoccus kalidii]MCF3934330.1 cysteine rich repeat-containing protein [Acuticoccus kalidii]
MRFVLASLIVMSGIALSGHAMAQQSAIAKYCKADVQRLCAGVQPGGKRILQCLQQHKNEMSVGCAKALKEMKSNR